MGFLQEASAVGSAPWNASGWAREASTQGAPVRAASFDRASQGGTVGVVSENKSGSECELEFGSESECESGSECEYESDPESNWKLECESEPGSGSESG
eukprot:2388539-Karenia_brevis.AAC.1